MQASDIPEIDGRSPWEVLVRMDAKLDVALHRIEDHEDRLRDAATQASVDALRAQVEFLALEHANLKAQPTVTPKGLLMASGSTVTLILGLLALLDKLVK